MTTAAFNPSVQMPARPSSSGQTGHVTAHQGIHDAVVELRTGLANVASTSNTAATQSVAGMMSSTDKAKLDGIASGANNFTTASAVAAVGGKLRFCTQSEYDAISVKDQNTLYVIS
jgi:hypothetical protein